MSRRSLFALLLPSLLSLSAGCLAAVRPDAGHGAGLAACPTPGQYTRAGRPVTVGSVHLQEVENRRRGLRYVRHIFYSQAGVRCGLEAASADRLYEGHVDQPIGEGALRVELHAAHGGYVSRTIYDGSVRFLGEGEGRSICFDTPQRFDDTTTDAMGDEVAVEPLSIEGHFVVTEVCPIKVY